LDGWRFNAQSEEFPLLKPFTPNPKPRTPVPHPQNFLIAAEMQVDRKVDIRLHGKGNSNSHSSSRQRCTSRLDVSLALSSQPRAVNSNPETQTQDCAFKAEVFTEDKMQLSMTFPDEAKLRMEEFE
jgi:hypothetical protein